MNVRHLTLDELKAGLPHLESSPKDRDATKFVNSKEGRRLHLRGINAKVVQSGTIRVGDLATKV